jgi:small glutamine-rich tetratricopeptide repeat-containing protein alpha
MESSPISSEDQRSGQVVLSFLHGLRSSSNGAQVDEAVNAVSALLGIDSATAAFEEHSYFPTKASDIISAGAASLGLKTYRDNLTAVKNDPKFAAFVETVSKKGYFHGVEEGSLEYLQRNAKLIHKFIEKTTSSAPAEPSKAEKEAAAELKKQEGNAALQSKNYELSIQLYSEAIELSPDGPNSHIYFANRSAAYCHINKYKEATKDCEASVKLSPTYAKAYSRLGLCHFCLNEFNDAVRAYEKAVELEPTNKAFQESLDQAKRKLQQEQELATQSQASNPLAGLGGAGGMPDLAAMASMLGGAGGAGGGGFMQMAQKMMQNPAFMQQAQAMMQNPAFMQQAQQMMQNPAMMRQAQEIMQNPEALGQLSSMMGAGGGDAPGIPPFSGFKS